MSEIQTSNKAIISKLLKMQIFSDFTLSDSHDSDIMETVCAHLKSKKIKAGNLIIKEGDFGDEFYILYEGQVNIFRNTLSGDIITLANLSDSMNVFFGETALISKDTRTASVKALSDCHVLVLNRDDFIKISEREPLFGYRVSLCIAKRLADNVRKTNGDMTTLYEALFNEIEDAGAR